MGTDRLGTGGRLTRAESQQEVPPGRLIQSLKVEGAVAFVAQQLKQGGTPFFLRGLKLLIEDANELHLERLDQEILGISTIRTRQRHRGFTI